MKALAAVLLALVGQTAVAGEFVAHTVAWHSKPSYETRHTTHYQYVVTYSYQVQTGPNTWTTQTAQYVAYEYDETTVIKHRLKSNTPGVGYISDGGWLIGIYNNSYDDVSTYVGKQIRLFDTNFSVNLLAATGYKYATGKDVVPMVALDYKIRLHDKWNAHVSVVPQFSANTSTAAMLSIGKEF